MDDRLLKEIKIASECPVLLENDGTLPLKKKGKVALFGNGARCTVKGGTGSGDVKVKEVINVELGLKNAGFEVTTGDWLSRFDQMKMAKVGKYMAWLDKEAKTTKKPVFSVYLSNPPKENYSIDITDDDMKNADTDTAVYVLARNSGEGSDRVNGEWDYLLSGQELKNIETLAEHFEKFIVILNIGGVIQLGELKKIKGINAILLMGQLGQGGGEAVADILTGKVTPSGKTVDTWAKDCMDYPSSREFSVINGNFQESRYTEGIYVGYRHFDTFRVEPEYCFGYGLSYTDFDISVSTAEVCGGNISLKVAVKNTGATYSGKEVVQIYVSAPKGRLDKPYQELIGFYKSRLLAPGESEERKVIIPVERMASYSETDRAWVLEAGSYVIRVGNSSRNTSPVLDMQLENIIFDTRPEDGKTYSDKIDTGALETAKTLSVEELALLCVGASRQTSEQSVIGNAAQKVPGAAGETTAVLDSKGIRSIVLADGPAGVRIEKECTAIPIGWSLAQSWNVDAAYDAGAIVGEEMLENEIDIWLAPALNIHRHPLCGRSFEYYSEDPLVSGRMAAAVVNGAQKRSGKGVTIKHFAANNQEENRYFINVQASERAMREIYLKGFEIAVKESAPMAIMTSYNLINGIHAANHKELIDIAREEWGFDGIVMTDWFTSQDVPEITDKYESEYPIASSVGCIYAGNDLQMPGCERNVRDIVKAVEDGTEIDGFKITRGDLEKCAARIISVVNKLGARD